MLLLLLLLVVERRERRRRIGPRHYKIRGVDRGEQGGRERELAALFLGFGLSLFTVEAECESGERRERERGQRLGVFFLVFQPSINLTLIALYAMIWCLSTCSCPGEKPWPPPLGR